MNFSVCFPTASSVMIRDCLMCEAVLGLRNLIINLLRTLNPKL